MVTKATLRAIATQNELMRQRALALREAYDEIGPALLALRVVSRQLQAAEQALEERKAGAADGTVS